MRFLSCKQRDHRRGPRADIPCREGGGRSLGALGVGCALLVWEVSQSHGAGGATAGREPLLPEELRKITRLGDHQLAWLEPRDVPENWNGLNAVSTPAFA